MLCHAKAGIGQDVSCCKVTPSEENHKAKLLKAVIPQAMAVEDNSDVAITAVLTSSQLYRMEEVNGNDSLEEVSSCHCVDT